MGRRRITLVNHSAKPIESVGWVEYENDEIVELKLEDSDLIKRLLDGSESLSLLMPTADGWCPGCSSQEPLELPK